MIICVLHLCVCVCAVCRYWHAHIDKRQYGSFLYTGLLYLNDHSGEFTGGEFVFIEQPQQLSDKQQQQSATQSASRRLRLEPRAGRFVAFTSGSENVHAVTRVRSGTRYALTIAFTCDHSKAVQELLHKADVLWQQFTLVSNATKAAHTAAAAA